MQPEATAAEPAAKKSAFAVLMFACALLHSSLLLTAVMFHTNAARVRVLATCDDAAMLKADQL